MKARVLVAGGFEGSSRMGLLADVETVRAGGGEPLLIETALTVQGKGARAVRATSPRLITGQVRALRELGPVHAIKTGLLPSRPVLRALRRGLADLDVYWVVDPIVRSSSGQTLSRLTREDFLSLAGPRVVLTPNLDEAAWLLGIPRPSNLARMQAAAQKLWFLGFAGVVLKGGHLGGDLADVVCTARGTFVLGAPRLARTPGQRGTGCRHASRVALGLAQGKRLKDAARDAQRAVARYLASGGGSKMSLVGPASRKAR